MKNLKKIVRESIFRVLNENHIDKKGQMDDAWDMNEYEGAMTDMDDSERLERIAKERDIDKYWTDREESSGRELMDRWVKGDVGTEELEDSEFSPEDEKDRYWFNQFGTPEDYGMKESISRIVRESIESVLNEGFHVFRRGVGPIFSAYPEEFVASFGTWKEAHEKMKLLQSRTSNFIYWIGDDDARKQYR